jgi:hypothetical protein
LISPVTYHARVSLIIDFGITLISVEFNCTEIAVSNMLAFLEKFAVIQIILFLLFSQLAILLRSEFIAFFLTLKGTRLPMSTANKFPAFT